MLQNLIHDYGFMLQSTSQEQQSRPATERSRLEQEQQQLGRHTSAGWLPDCQILSGAAAWQAGSSRQRNQLRTPPFVWGTLTAPLKVEDVSELFPEITKYWGMD